LARPAPPKQPRPPQSTSPLAWLASSGQSKESSRRTTAPSHLVLT
jgi:hypothetical protein